MGRLSLKGTRQMPIAGVVPSVTSRNEPNIPSVIRRKHAETPAIHLNSKQVDRTNLYPY